MSTTAEKAIEKLPLSFLVFSILSGLILLFLSPVRYFLPLWVVDPFSLENPLNVMWSFLVILVVSFCMGIIPYLIQAMFLGERGLNHRIAVGLGYRTRANESEQTRVLAQAETIRLFDWLRKHKLRSYGEILIVKSTFISALFTGSEVAIVLDLIILPFLFLERIIMLYGILLLTCPVVIFFLTLVFNSWYFRDDYRAEWNRWLETYHSFESETD
jgi:hypothetical protein